MGYYSAGGGLGWIGGRTSPSSGVRLALAGVDAEQCVEGAEASNGGHCHDRCNNPQDDGQYAGGQHSADCGGDGDDSTDDAVDVVLVFSHDLNLIDISLKGLVEGTVVAPECLLHHYRLLRAVEKLNQSPAMCLNFRVACSCALFRARTSSTTNIDRARQFGNLPRMTPGQETHSDSARIASAGCR